MSSNSAKFALVPLVLATTWATAQATDNVSFSFTPDASQTAGFDNLHLFTQDYNLFAFGPYDIPISEVPGSALMSPNFGSVVPPGTASGTEQVSYNSGTSASLELLGTSGTNTIFLGGVSNDYAAIDTYLETGSNFSTIFNAIVSGDSSTIDGFVGDQSFPNSPMINPNFYDPGVGSSQPFIALATFTLQTGGSVTDSETNVGAASMLVTPEPAPMAALGLGVLALVRRGRRKLA